MINYGLVSPRLANYAPPEMQDKLIALIEDMRVEGRCFPQFAAYNKFLVELYHNQKPNQTIADLYPQIIEWFEQHN